jgi:hypothetical protein
LLTRQTENSRTIEALQSVKAVKPIIISTVLTELPEWNK